MNNSVGIVPVRKFSSKLNSQTHALFIGCMHLPGLVNHLTLMESFQSVGFYTTTRVLKEIVLSVCFVFDTIRLREWTHQV
jgi:hypothetical protein